MNVRHLKYILLINLSLLILCSCIKHDTSRVITGIKIYPVTNEKSTKEQIIDGWYFSKFQDLRPRFLIYVDIFIDFEVLSLTEYNSFYWQNYPIDSSLKIFTDKQLVFNQDTIEEKKNIVKYFNVTKKEKGGYHSIYYELILKDSICLKTNNSYCTFFSSLEINDGVVYNDSCLICFK